MNVEIRRAKSEEADVLTQIAHAAKRHWKYPESWIAKWKPDLTITAEFIADNEVFVAVHDEQTIGCCALLLSNSTAELEHMWIDPRFMGSGVGRALFFHAKRRAQELGANLIELSADPNAEKFYERMGAKRVGQVPADVDGQPRVLPRMRVEL
jgi:N-acetylglutamate synthase-like GNAT family acetyltransferase